MDATLAREVPRCQTALLLIKQPVQVTHAPARRREGERERSQGREARGGAASQHPQGFSTGCWLYICVYI